MKISTQWILKLVDSPKRRLDADELSEIFSSIGLAVEGRDELGEDVVLDLEVTTNRPDCLNHVGVAREACAAAGGTLNLPDLSAPEARAFPGESWPAQVVIEEPELCPRYAARVLTDVRIEASPPWLATALDRLGLRPINNVVDITNYVLMELGHPLHAFDYDLLQERTIRVRRADAGARMRTLDGVERSLDDSMLMICDALRPVAVAGVMGGEETEISERTRTILVESAYFAPASVRATAKSLGLRTEASYRFERGADPEMPVKALNRACRLIEEIAGGRTVGPLIDQFPRPLPSVVLELRSQRIHRILGVTIGPATVEEILARLQFAVTPRENGDWTVGVPSFRSDVSLEDDLVEEVARHSGFDRIPSTYPPATVPGGFRLETRQEAALTGLLQDLGFYEAYNYAFRSARKDETYWQSPPAMVQISNPLTEEYSHLRNSLLPGLVESMRRNLNHGMRDIRLFEIGNVFLPASKPNGSPVREELRIGLIAGGTQYRPYWSEHSDDFRFFHLKGILELVAERLQHRLDFERAEGVPFLHPGSAARIILDGRPVGCAGELHPRLQEANKFLQKVFLAEWGLEETYRSGLSEPRYQPLPRFPAVTRDLSFAVDKSLEYARIVDAIEDLKIAQLVEIQIIDLFHGSNLPKGKVSLTLRLTFADAARTLTQEEVAAFSDRVVDLMVTRYSAQGRT